MIVDIAPGVVTVRDAEKELELTLDVTLTPGQARAIARNLRDAGKHTVAAEGLFRAADQAEIG